MSDSEVNEATQGFGMLFRVGMQAASRIAEKNARNREQRMREAQAHSEQAAREFRERLGAEQRAAEAQLQPAFTESWWQQATPDHIAATYEHAEAWKDHSPIATQVADRIRYEVHTRYGIDVTNDPKAVAQLRAQAENKKGIGEDEARSAGEDRVTAATMMNEADRIDRAREQPQNDLQQATAWAKEHEPQWFDDWSLMYSNADTQDAKRRDERDLISRLQQATRTPPTEQESTELRDTAAQRYDSAERREALAQDMTAAGVDSETVAARISADLDQGVHPREAVRAPKKAPIARKGKPGQSQSREREHSGR
ncbi:MAG: hypothetical protein WAW17_18270 [Rhodococcus sp. (in: high G+C Gram-positive bacteria)]|uniref:hypothetical protein n=1 Tax=Rhodococcus sp. TaxID=1831 RepID=UPI003BAF4D38